MTFKRRILSDGVSVCIRWATSTWGSSTEVWQSCTTTRPSRCSSASKMPPVSCSAHSWRGWPLLSLLWQVSSSSRPVMWCCQQYFSVFKCEGETQAGQLAAAYSDAKSYVPKGQSSSTAKMKSLTGAMEIMTETRHALQLIYNELLEEQVKIHLGTRDCSALFGMFMLSRIYSGFIITVRF